jgi:4-amino-4-deoxy-L-arabinose transferase-like glycosyltransferase
MPAFRKPIAILLLVCALVFWVRLGDGGFHASEAHRVAPAYEMLDSGHWLVPHLFGQPYLRKPPGMPWAIAGMSELLGRTEFAARAVSALASTLMALLAFAFAARWFGPRVALAAGLAQALMPVLWESGRAAEIEALNHLATQAAALCLIDALMYARTRKARLALALGAGIAIAGAALAKGPASAPVLLAVIAAACVVGRSLRPLTRIVWVALIPAGAIIGALALAIARAVEQLPLQPVLQSPEAFLFEAGRLLAIAALIPSAFLQCMPVALVLLFPWGPDAKSEVGPDLSHRGFTVARTLAVAWLIAVGVFMLAGVSNPRYTLPAAALLPPLVSYVALGLGGAFTPRRARIARALSLTRPWAWPVILILASAVYIHMVEAQRRATSGHEAGIALGGAIAEWARAEHHDEVVVLADHLIEARPEVLLSLQHGATRSGLHTLRVRWVPGLGRTRPDHTPEAGEGIPLLLLLREDDGSDEASALGRFWGDRVGPAPGALHGPWVVHKYRFFVNLAVSEEFSDQPRVTP